MTPQPKRKGPATRFGGPRGNKPGMTALQREIEIENAAVATRIRGRLLKAVDTVASKATDAAALSLIEAGVLKLLKDAEDRGLGAPKTAVELSNPDGSLGSDAMRAAVVEHLKRLHAGAKP